MRVNTVFIFLLKTNYYNVVKYSSCILPDNCVVKCRLHSSLISSIKSNNCDLYTKVVFIDANAVREYDVRS